MTSKLHPIAGTLNVNEHTLIDDSTGNKRVELWGFDGSSWNRAIVNSSGALSTTGGGGGGGAVTTDYQYAEDSAHTTGNVGAFVLAVRNALLADLTDTQLDYSPIAVDAKGRVIVDASTTTVTVQDGGNTITVDNGGTFATQDSQTITDNAGFTDGTSKVFMAGYVFDETAGTALTENDAAAARVDSKRSIITVIEDATTRGRRLSINADGSMPVDTELPAAAALADDKANPTTSLIGAFHHEFDGTNWDRIRHSFTQTRNGLTTGSGAGTAVDLTMTPCREWALQVIQTAGTVSAFNIQLEVSLNGSTWFSAVNGTSASGNDQIFWAGDKPAFHMRSNVTSITGSGGTVTVIIMGMR